MGAAQIKNDKLSLLADNFDNDLEKALVRSRSVSNEAQNLLKAPNRNSKFSKSKKSSVHESVASSADLHRLEIRDN